MKRSLALSGAIHALFLLALLLGGLPRMEVSPTRVIQVLLLEDAPGRGAAADGGRAARTVVKPAPPESPPRRERETVKKSPAKVPRPIAPRDETVARPAAIRVSSQPAATAPSDIVPGGGARGASSAAESGGSESAASSGDERDHRIAIIRRRIQEALVYPREARRRGIQGTSQVRFDLTDAGRLRTLALARSSGKKLLDDASLETLERAQPFPFIDGTLIVPVVFRLSDMRRP